MVVKQDGKPIVDEVTVKVLRLKALAMTHV